MFIIDLTYTASLEKIDAHMADHVKFLNKYYKENKFVTSGRKVPRTGGIILAVAQSKDEIEEIITQDPFIREGLAQFTITEFNNSQYHPALKTLIKGRP